VDLERIIWRWKTRRQRREYRQTVQRWYADGGDERFRFDYDLDRSSLVLDLGGFEGQWASDIYARFRCRVLVFETVPTFAARIAERFRRNDDIEVHDCGLGATTRSETMHLHGAGTSAYRRDAATVETRIVDVAAWFAEHEIESVQLMKINIEGGEFEVLERLLETGLVARIENLQVQFHFIGPESPARMRAIQQSLAATHAPTYQYPFVWENWALLPRDSGKRPGRTVSRKL
jgi:FkbM family methyltransferase